MRTWCVFERTAAYQRVEGEKNSLGFVFLFRFASFPFPVFAIIQYISRPPQKPVTVPHRGPKYLHSVSRGLPSVAERAEDRAICFCFRFLLSSFDVLSACTTEIRPRRRCRYLYIGMFYVLCHRIPRRYALPHVYLYLHL